MSFVSTSTEFAMMDTRSNSGALVLPLTTDIPGRIINIKDTYGSFTNSTLTVYTQGGEFFEDGTNFKVLNNAYDQFQVYTASTTRWYITGGTEQNITSQNLAIISTIQTFSWQSLCNNSITGYGTTFNPIAQGRISLLDNIFTSSTAGLASTFIEFGNLNAQPLNMTPGNAFRWLVGVEPSAQASFGLDFKIKRWISFSNANSNFYGANNSTLQDVTIWDPTTNVNQMPSLIHTGPFLLSSFSNHPTSAALRFAGAGTSNYIQFGSTMRTDAGGNLIFSGINASPELMRLQSGVAGAPAPGVRLGIGCNAPSYALDVNGTARNGMPVSSITGVIANVGLTGFGVFYYIRNAGFCNLVLPTTDPSFSGWFITLRNNTGSYLSVTITGTNSKIPASPFSIAPANSVSLAYDTSPPSGGCNWVYF